MTSKKPTITQLTFRHYWHVSLSHRKDLLIALLYPVGGVCMSIGVPYFIGKIFASLTVTTGRPEAYLLPLIIISLIGVTANRIGMVQFMIYQSRVLRDLQRESLLTLLKRNVGFHNNRISGKLVSDALEYPNAFGQLTNAIFLNVLPFLLIIISGITIVMLHSITMGFALILIVGITLFWAYRESLTRSHLRSVRLKATKAVIAHLSDTIINTQTVKTFAQEDQEMQRHTVLSTTLLDLRMKDWTRAVVSGSNRIGALLVMQVIFIVLVIHLVHKDPSLLAIGIFSFTYTLTLISRLFEINNMTRSIEESLLQASPMIEILQESPEVVDKLNAGPLEFHKGTIIFHDVSFKYPDSNSQQAVFEHLDLTIPAGKKIGLVGPSGGGKSTLTRLLLRFEDIQQGSILIDNQNIADVTQTSLHQAIGYVPQEPLLFHRSVRENITYGKPKATDTEIEAAARKAYALDFIKTLPNGLDTIVGERGVKLSGGQRQRIAIARAILKDAPILVLDEATSALDSESELVIQKALTELMENRTTIVIAHRLSTIQKMDQIIVMDEGRITEKGTHAELIQTNGTYARLWKHQSGGFIEE